MQTGAVFQQRNMTRLSDSDYVQCSFMVNILGNPCRFKKWQQQLCPLAMLHLFQINITILIVIWVF